MSVTYLEAAAILCCGISSVSRAVERGELHVRKDGAGRTLRPALSRREVEALRDRRQEDRQSAEDARWARQWEASQRRPRPPDTVHEWVGVTQAAELLGMTPVAVRKRVAAATIPVVDHSGQHWFRGDHMRLMGRARRARTTRQVDALAVVVALGHRLRSPEDRERLSAVLDQIEDPGSISERVPGRHAVWGEYVDTSAAQWSDPIPCGSTRRRVGARTSLGATAREPGPST